MNRPALVLACALLAGCAHQPSEFTIGAAPVQPAPPGVSFAGTWAYNAHDSDRPGEGMRSFAGRRDAFGGRAAFPGGAGGSFTGEGTFGEGEGERGGRPEGGRIELDSTLRQPPQRLVITQTDSTITISPRDSVAYTLFFDGRYVPAPALLGGTRIGLSGRWRGKRFEVERRLNDGTTVTQGYELTRHGRRLVIHVRLSRTGSNMPLPEFLQVYDRQ